MNNEELNNLPRFMSIAETAKTRIISSTLLRKLVKQGKVPGIYSGKKFLINFPLFVQSLDAASVPDKEMTQRVVMNDIKKHE